MGVNLVANQPHFFKTKRSRLKVERLKTFAALHNIRSRNNESRICKDEVQPMEDIALPIIDWGVFDDGECDCEPEEHSDCEIDGCNVNPLGCNLDVFAS